MRNSRNNFIPVPTKPAKNAPRAVSKSMVHRKSSSCQTERVVLIKEENLTFYPCTRLGQNDGGMRRDYAKAVNYINSCHKFINTIIEKNNSDKNNIFLLPMVTNFIPIFPYLTSKKLVRRKEPEKPPEEKFAKKEERKNRSTFGIKKEEEPSLDLVPVGDCGKNVQQIQQDNYAHQVAGVVKEQIQQFLAHLQADMDKAAKKVKKESSQSCKNLDIVKQRLTELSKICYIQKENKQLVEFSTAPKPPLLMPKDFSEDCSVILSDTDCEETKTKTDAKIICSGSVSSLMSESSDIRSDTDLEINNV